MGEQAVRCAFWFEKATGRLLVMDEVGGAGRHAFACDLQLVPAASEIEGRVAWIESPGYEWRLAVCVVPPASGMNLVASAGWSSAGESPRAAILQLPFVMLWNGCSQWNGIAAILDGEGVSRAPNQDSSARSPVWSGLESPSRQA